MLNQGMFSQQQANNGANGNGNGNNQLLQMGYLQDG